MPTYIYRREDGTHFEMIESMKDDPLEICPETGQKVRRVITGGQPFQLSSKGFPSEQLRNKNKLRKALEKNPFHTTTQDRDSHIRNAADTRRQKILDMQAKRKKEGGKPIDFRQESVSLKDVKPNPEVMKQLDKLD